MTMSKDRTVVDLYARDFCRAVTLHPMRRGDYGARQPYYYDHIVLRLCVASAFSGLSAFRSPYEHTSAHGRFRTITDTVVSMTRCQRLGFSCMMNRTRSAEAIVC